MPTSWQKTACFSQMPTQVLRSVRHPVRRRSAANRPPASTSRTTFPPSTSHRRTRFYSTHRNSKHCPPETITYAEMLSDAGYICGFFGKWHLSLSDWSKGGRVHNENTLPDKQGFVNNVGGNGNGGPPREAGFLPIKIHIWKMARKANTCRSVWPTKLSPLSKNIRTGHSW